MQRLALRASAHRLNNLLTVIVGNLDLLRGDVDPSLSTGPEWQQIERAAEEARILVASLSARKLGSLPLCATLRAFESSLSRILTAGSCLELEVPAEESWVYGDRHLLRHLIATLVMECREARRQRGCVRMVAEGRDLCIDDLPGEGVEERRKMLQGELDPSQREGSVMLAFAGGIVAKLGAELVLQLRPDGGLRFRLRFAHGEPTMVESEIASIAESQELAQRSRVLLVDDHTLMLDTLHRALAGEEEIEVVGAAEGGAEAVAKAAELTPDIVVMDLDMPGLDSFEAIDQIRALTPAPQIVILSAYSNAQHVERAMRAGARGYLTKSESLSCVRDAIRQVARGGSYFSEEVRVRVVDPGSATLTDRELQVLRGVVDGLARKEIADRLHISVKTVDRHVENIMQKLDIHDRVALARYAIREGLVRP